MPTPPRSDSEAPGGSRITPIGLLVRIASFILAWWAFTEGSWKDWPLAIAIIVLASITSVYLLPLRSWHWRLTGLIRFIPYFLWQSFLGGFDVARRALQSNMRLSPGFYQYTTRLPAGLPQVFMVWTISLLPGTASVTLENDQITIHALNDDANIEGEMQDLEKRINRIFGNS
jgi:multicomponent Na+:H+ antiporter subunit E